MILRGQRLTIFEAKLKIIRNIHFCVVQVRIKVTAIEENVTRRV
jgi:hypothetical protein